MDSDSDQATADHYHIRFKKHSLLCGQPQFVRTAQKSP
jgi:hypothetical protein